MSREESRAAGIAAACVALAEGRLVGMPTETVYGLAADATDGKAVARIFEAKGRPRFNPLIVHVASLAEAEKFAILPPEARRVAEAFWPGPLTLVVARREASGLSDLVTAGLDTVAIRVPAHPVAQALLSAFGRPLAAPSANRSGHVSATTAAHVAADLGEAVAIILDAGSTGIGVESTIIGFDENGPLLLRPGGLAREAIERELGRELGKPHASGKVSAPGMLASHYAPAAELRLNAKEVREGEALLTFGSDLPQGTERAVTIRNLSSSGDLVEAAANLFTMLRDLDTAASKIAAMPIPEEGLGEAINDRLRRAAAPRP